MRSPFIFRFKKRPKISEDAKPRLSADFPSRRLLSSRLRVTPSSRRKATVDALRCHSKEKVQTFSFEVLNSTLVFFFGIKSKIAPIHGSLVQRELARSA